MKVQEAIQNSYLAEGLTADQLAKFFAIAETVTFEDGEVILQQFDPTSDLYVLVSGRANILTVVGEPIGVIREGMPVGEISFLDEKPRSVSVVSVGPTEAVRLPAAELRQVFADHPDIAARALYNISRVLCARLRSANNNIAALMAIDECEAEFGL